VGGEVSHKVSSQLFTMAMKAQIIDLLEASGIDRKKVLFFDELNNTKKVNEFFDEKLKPKVSKVRVSKNKRPDTSAVEGMLKGLPDLLASLSNRQLPSWRKKAYDLLDVSSRELNLVKEGKPAFEELDALDAPDLPLFLALVDEQEKIVSECKTLHGGPLRDDWNTWTRNEKEKRLLEAFRNCVDMRNAQMRINDLFHDLTKLLTTKS